MLCVRNASFTRLGVTEVADCEKPGPATKLRREAVSVGGCEDANVSLGLRLSSCGADMDSRVGEELHAFGHAVWMTMPGKRSHE